MALKKEAQELSWRSKAALKAAEKLLEAREKARKLKSLGDESRGPNDQDLYKYQEELFQIRGSRV